MANSFNYKITQIISEEHNNLKCIYGTVRLKYHVENKYQKEGIKINHKLIIHYKNILGLKTIKRSKKGLSVTRAKEKNLINKVPYLIECNFNLDAPNQKYSSDVSYIKCKDGTLYLSTIKDYFNTKIILFSTSNYNNIELIKASYNNFKPNKNVIVNIDQRTVYFAYEYIELTNIIEFTRSMSHKGHCWENFSIENWFMQLKNEWLCQFDKLTRK